MKDIMVIRRLAGTTLMNKKNADAAELGLLDQNKLEKRAHIRTAARELFSELGYEATTARHIARRAHVGIGTLYLYANDKRDLVYLICNEELEIVTDQAINAPSVDQPLFDQIIAIFGTHYVYYGKDPTLSRIILRELVFYPEGQRPSKFEKVRAQLLRGIEEFVKVAQQEERICATHDPAVIARCIFCVFSNAIRWWIATPHPEVRAGIAELRQLLTVLFSGLECRDSTGKSTRDSPRLRRSARVT
jgi:AcrR family transcriptional regulator